MRPRAPWASPPPPPEETVTTIVGGRWRPPGWKAAKQPAARRKRARARLRAKASDYATCGRCECTFRKREFADHPCEPVGEEPLGLPVPVAARGSATFYSAVSAAFPEEHAPIR